MLPDKDIMCHRTGFTLSCRKCVTEHNCQLWVDVLGNDPQTDATMNYSACVDRLLPKLLIENSKHTREVGAAIESFRNEHVERANKLNENLEATLRLQTYITDPSHNYNPIKQIECK